MVSRYAGGFLAIAALCLVVVWSTNAARADDLPAGVEVVEKSISSFRVGTGFVVDSSGLLVTCWHVVQDAARIEVTLGDREYTAIIQRTDPKHDLAVLRLRGGGSFPVIPLAPKGAGVLGEDVRAFGFPLASALGTGLKVTRGAISGIDADGDERTLQVDVPVNPGNSGGPLVDAHGRVIGIITSRYEEANNFGAAVPVSVLFPLLERHREEAAAGSPLEGPELVKRVAPAVAFLRVHTNAPSHPREASNQTEQPVAANPAPPPGKTPVAQQAQPPNAAAPPVSGVPADSGTRAGNANPPGMVAPAAATPDPAPPVAAPPVRSTAIPTPAGTDPGNSPGTSTQAPATAPPPADPPTPSSTAPPSRSETTQPAKSGNSGGESPSSASQNPAAGKDPAGTKSASTPPPTPGPAPTAIPAPTPVTSAAPPATPTAAPKTAPVDIDRELDGIRADAPDELPQPQSDPSAAAKGKQVEWQIVNLTVSPLKIVLRGPVKQSVTVAPGKTSILMLPAGEYEVGARLEGANVSPLYSHQQFDPGERYRSRFHVDLP